MASRSARDGSLTVEEDVDSHTGSAKAAGEAAMRFVDDGVMAQAPLVPVEPADTRGGS